MINHIKGNLEFLEWSRATLPLFSNITGRVYRSFSGRRGLYMHTSACVHFPSKHWPREFSVNIHDDKHISWKSML